MYCDRTHQQKPKHTPASQHNTPHRTAPVSVICVVVAVIVVYGLLHSLQPPPLLLPLPPPSFCRIRPLGSLSTPKVLTREAMDEQTFLEDGAKTTCPCSHSSSIRYPSRTPLVIGRRSRKSFTVRIEFGVGSSWSRTFHRFSSSTGSCRWCSLSTPGKYQ